MRKYDRGRRETNEREKTNRQNDIRKPRRKRNQKGNALDEE